MPGTIYRVAIVGASSLVGKELSEVLSESALGSASFALFDDEEAAGKLAAAGDEISFVRRLDESSFEGMDLVFFSGEATVARKYLAAARQAGADVIDLTGGLEGAPGATIGEPRLGVRGLRTTTSATQHKAANGPEVVIVAHPAAQMLATVARQLESAFGLKGLAATVMLPASEYGRAAVDELHRQTVSLLGFQAIPQEQYGLQVAFNLVGEFGEASLIQLEPTEQRIARHYRALMPNGPVLSLQVIHAPIFHGTAASIFAEVVQPTTPAALEQLFPRDVCPTPLSVLGRAEIEVRGRIAEGSKDGLRLELWAAADNVRMLAQSAVECGVAFHGDTRGMQVQ